MTIVVPEWILFFVAAYLGWDALLNTILKRKQIQAVSLVLDRVGKVEDED